MDSEKDSFIVQKWRQAFNFFDVNKDGVMDADDLSNLANYVSQKTRASEQQTTKTRNEWTKWVELLQSDPSCPLDEAAFLKGSAKMMEDPENYKKLMRYTFNDLFDRIDLDGDGLISKEELDIFYESVGVTNQELTRRAFDNIDANGDGFIQREELVEDLVRHFSHPDPVEGKAYFISVTCSNDLI